MALFPDVSGRRPLGVSVLAIVVLAFGVVTALVGLFDTLRGAVEGLMGSPNAGARALLGGAGLLLLGAVYFVAGAGLWSMRPWAWWLAAAASVVGLVVAFGAVVTMAIWAAVLVYLVLVRKSFGVLPNVPSPSQA
jgi:hypothetical protein